MKNIFKIFNFKTHAIGAKPLCIVHCVLCILLAGCEQKDLCYDHSHVVDLDIDFDWHNDPEAHPASMVLYFFPKDGGKPSKYNLAGNLGGTIRILAGDYDVICFNSDTHNITLTQTDEEYSFTISAKDEYPASPSSHIPGFPAEESPHHEGGADDERYAMQSEDMWEATLTDLAILQNTPEEEANHTHRHVTLTPEKVTDTYHIIIKNIVNMNMLRNLEATLSGMAGGLNAASHHTTDEEVTLSFGIDFYRDSESAYAKVISFGNTISHLHGHYLTIYAKMSNGETYYYDFDVSEQINHPTGEGHEHYVVIDLLELDSPISQGLDDDNPTDEEGSGFGVSVSEWGDAIDVNLKM